MPSKHARNIALTPELDAFVSQLLESGTYSNASEVVRAGLRELERRHWADQLTGLQARIVTGLNQLDRGKGVGGTPAKVLGNVLEQVKERQKTNTPQ